MKNSLSSLLTFREFGYSMTFDTDPFTCVTPCCECPDCTGCSAMLRYSDFYSYHLGGLLANGCLFRIHLIPDKDFDMLHKARL